MFDHDDHVRILRIRNPECAAPLAEEFPPKIPNSSRKQATSRLVTLHSCECALRNNCIEFSHCASLLRVETVACRRFARLDGTFACAFADVRDATAVRRNTRRCAATCTAPMSARSRAGRASLARDAVETRAANVSPISPTEELHVGRDHLARNAD